MRRSDAEKAADDDGESVEESINLLGFVGSAPNQVLIPPGPSFFYRFRVLERLIFARGIRKPAKPEEVKDGIKTKSKREAQLVSGLTQIRFLSSNYVVEH